MSGSAHPGRRRYDVIVVGAGMAGSLVAKRLGDQGWRVLVLEAGTGTLDTWPGHLDALDTFASAVAKVPNSPYRPNAVAPSPDVLDVGGLPGGGYRAHGYLVQRGALPYNSDYLRASGGTGLHWLGLTPRMHPDDFTVRSRYGYGRDWPIGYDDLEAHYRAAERELGVAGDAAEQADAIGLPFPEDYVYPMREIPRSYLDDVLAARLDGHAVQEKPGSAHTTLRVVTTPHARNSTPHEDYDGGRGYRPVGAAGLPNYGERCVGNASCTPICPAQAKYTPLKTQAAWSRDVTLVTRAVVSRVLTTSGGRARGVEYQEYDDPAAPASVTRTAEADVVVLAAHAIENAKLLLVSQLATRSDQVGRNLMDHPVLLTWGLMNHPVGPFRGPGSTSGLEGFRTGAGRRTRAPFRIVIANWGWSWPAGSPGADVARLLGMGDDSAAPRGRGLFGAALREELGRGISRQFALQFEMEQEAEGRNRVTIDPLHRDLLGNPRPVVTYDLSDRVKRGMAAAKAVSDQIFGLLDAEDHTAYGPGPFAPGHFRFEGRDFVYQGAGHGAGTHVMGASRETSVVDQWQRCWDHPGLYAVGCGSMPSVGTANPSLTMAALALRSSERIHRELSELRRPLTVRTAHAPEVRP
ncbi:GMC family oxidoreductase [Streptomyces netropsis]|uniref:Choline dehydrogenase-like flavoprotein n=1 Tax=Streptomyces netropsis TaxID=55404 RepID=A0A7W7L7W5_STRNE|nr:GMC family oxidoreductase [Streptomyces netropsis]MBB4885267.1 choline dehydrogenase-like flavoprotein [Streptomyces netropsis]GGR27915.1 dehydrogenase [Streptomyces netropsis]